MTDGGGGVSEGEAGGRRRTDLLGFRLALNCFGALFGPSAHFVLSKPRYCFGACFRCAENQADGSPFPAQVGVSGLQILWCRVAAGRASQRGCEVAIIPEFCPRGRWRRPGHGHAYACERCPGLWGHGRRPCSWLARVQEPACATSD